MTTDHIERLTAQVVPYGLFVMGHVCEGSDTIFLIGADKDFWGHFTQSPEFSDAQPDPIDRWSKRLLNTIAQEHDGSAIFPSDGPPFAPFIAWATKSGRFWQSPTGMLIHDKAGLMISIRGAIRVPVVSRPQPLAERPCGTCPEKPCATACPVLALSTQHFYDVPTCKIHLDTSQGTDCMLGGCLVRQACPVSQSFNRPAEQSAFHMNAFMGIKHRAK